MSATSIDFFRVAINLDGNKATIREMLQLFLISTQELLDQFEIMIAAQNTSECRAILHKLKGGAQNMAAMPLVELCKEGESLAAAGVSLVAHCDAIKSEFSNLKAAIEQHLLTLN